ncbi:MAG: hypothetical protein WAN36_07785 [Calditrichia bacterium]
MQPFFWGAPDNGTEGPLKTYFRLENKKDAKPMVLCFIGKNHQSGQLSMDFLDKGKLFIAEQLPGFIHNLNGPLGTVTGRIELLSLKNNNLSGLDDVLKMGLRIHSMLENFSFKVVHEQCRRPVEISINRFLREELKFLETDLFLKHQVKVKERFSLNIPQFKMQYGGLSGVLYESYRFVRRFVTEDQEYVLTVGSFSGDGTAGFYFNFLGNFVIPEKLNLHFPVEVKGDFRELNQQKVDGIDLKFLSFCLSINRGHFHLVGRKEVMSMRLEFPLPSGKQQTDF